MGVYLFKKSALILVCFLAFCSGAFANAFMIEPFERNLQNNGSIDLGMVAAGETLRIALERKSGYGFQWDRLSLGSALPPGWNFSFQRTDKTLVALIFLPRTAEESVQKISMVSESDAAPFASESFSAFVTVKKNLLAASIEGLKQQSVVGEKAVFVLTINNDSIAGQELVVSSDLPDYWFASPPKITVPPRETVDVNLFVFPQNYGTKNFSFRVASSLTSFEQQFSAELSTISTLKGKFSCAMYGFPFFAPSLLPHLIINSFLALFS